MDLVAGVFRFLFLAMLLPTVVQAGVLLQGEYKLVGHIYQGAQVPPFNPNLNMRLSFYKNGTERLYWDREGESGFCERFANYQIEDGQITEVVFAVNPNNSFECAQDPDMRVGRKTTSKIELQQQQILLYLPMGDEELIYIFKEIQ